jgi:hypothetical protein
MQRGNSSTQFARALRIPAWLAIAALLPAVQTGCINSMVMMGKVLLGDPVQKSAFEIATGVSLKKAEKQILVHCSSPSYVTDEYSTLNSDIQEELIRRMKRHDLLPIHTDVSGRILDARGGRFDAQLLAREAQDVGYIMHIQIEKFNYLEDSSPSLYRGHMHGHITGYEVRGEGPERHAVQVFQQDFQVHYPTTYPVPIDQTPKNVFIRRFVDHAADTLGASFYNVTRSDLYAN